MDKLLPTQMFPRLPARAKSVADTNFLSGTQKNVSDFVHKHFVSAANVSQFAQPKKHHHDQQCVRNNVSSFMHGSILVQGCKNLSLIEDCSKTYRTTFDEMFTVDFVGVNHG